MHYLGLLSVFEQDCHAFSRFLPNFLLPGPLCYVPKIDAFVTCNSQMEIECYRYQILASSSASQKRESGSNSDSGLTAAKRLQVRQQ
jgi:Bardet-Biedl syndrome 9 protein